MICDVLCWFRGSINTSASAGTDSNGIWSEVGGRVLVLMTAPFSKLSGSMRFTVVNDERWSRSMTLESIRKSNSREPLLLWAFGDFISVSILVRPPNPIVFIVLVTLLDFLVQVSLSLFCKSEYVELSNGKLKLVADQFTESKSALIVPCDARDCTVVSTITETNIPINNY